MHIILLTFHISTTLLSPSNTQPVCLTLTEAQTDQMRTMYCLFQLTHLQHPENVQFNFLDKLSSEFYEYIVLIGDRIINTRIQHQVRERVIERETMGRRRKDSRRER